MMLPVKYFTNEEVSRTITVSECIEVIDSLFKNIEDTQMPPKVYMNIPNGDFRAMPAIVGNTAGIKWCGVHLDETGTKRKINIFAKILINDVEGGSLLAMLDGEALTAIRTAAVTGVATNYLAPRHAKTAAFIGCGNQTRRQIEAVLSVRDIKTIKLYDLSEERANTLKEDLNYLQVRQAEPVNVLVCDDLEDCLWDSDIVTTLTPSRDPFIKHRYLKPVVHINAVGADADGKRELHPCVLAGVDLVSYDEWVQCSHSGEIQYSKTPRRGQIWSPLSLIINGTTEIASAKQTLFDATGLAIEDVATARYIYDKFKRTQ
jgi:alanine dehydrogenase